MVLAATAAALLTAPVWMDVAHGDQHDSDGWELVEPFFVARSTPESEIEFEFEYEHSDEEDEIGLGLGGSLAVWEERLQFGVEVPVGIRIPDDGPTVADLGDVEFSVLLRLTKLENNGGGHSFALLGEVAAPTGDEGKEIGGTGSWGISGTGGFTVSLGSKTTKRMGVQYQVGYEQKIHLTDEQREEAIDLGVRAVLETEIVWGVAANLADGEGTKSGPVPSLEVVGRTILEAIDDEEEGTIVEVGGGVWWKIGQLEIGLAAKGPVSGMKESNYTVLFVVSREFGE